MMDPPYTETSPDETSEELLGNRQEQFLARWTKLDPDMLKVCLAASI